MGNGGWSGQRLSLGAGIFSAFEESLEGLDKTLNFIYLYTHTDIVINGKTILFVNKIQLHLNVGDKC